MTIVRKLPPYNFNTLNRPLNVLFCLPGDNYSGKFIQSWTRLLIWCLGHGINCEIFQMYSSNIYHVRECFLSYNVILDTKKVKAFGGKNYDFVFWLDSDQIFLPEQFHQLLLHDCDIIGAAIRVQMNDEYAFGWIDKDLLEKKNELKRWRVQDMEHIKEPFEVDYAGLAFTLVKRGVFESLEFPWFEPVPYSEYIPGKVGFMGEDMSICHRLRKKGFRIYIDPQVKVGHEKKIVI